MLPKFILQVGRSQKIDLFHVVSLQVERGRLAGGHDFFVGCVNAQLLQLFYIAVLVFGRIIGQK